MEKTPRRYFFLNAEEQDLISDLEAARGSTHTHTHIPSNGMFCTISSLKYIKLQPQTSRVSY